MSHFSNDTNFSAKGFDKIFSHAFKIVLDTRGKRILSFSSVNSVNIILTQLAQQAQCRYIHHKRLKQAFLKAFKFLAFLVYLLGVVPHPTPTCLFLLFYPSVPLKKKI